MIPRRIGVDEARPFWAHSSQHLMGLTPDILPDSEAFQYWACGPICGVFHLSHWPGVWMGHYGVKPEGWGHLRDPARAILRAFWAAESPERVIGWTDEKNRAACAFARRIGFVADGIMPLRQGRIIMQGWRA